MRGYISWTADLSLWTFFESISRAFFKFTSSSLLFIEQQESLRLFREDGGDSPTLVASRAVSSRIGRWSEVLKRFCRRNIKENTSFSEGVGEQEGMNVLSLFSLSESCSWDGLSSSRTGVSGQISGANRNVGSSKRLSSLREQLSSLKG